MKKVLGAIAITAAMLATTAAFAENTSAEKRAELAKLWGKDTAVTARQTPTATMNFTGLDKQRRDQLADRWAEDHRLGRQHERAGR